jgi:hypothetical protein
LFLTRKKLEYIHKLPFSQNVRFCLTPNTTAGHCIEYIVICFGKYKVFNICIALAGFVFAVHFRSIWVFALQLVSCIVRSFVSFIVRSYFVSCVRLIKLTNETNEPITQTKRKRTENERTIHANEANEKRKRYEISVNLNDPGSVGRLLSYLRHLCLFAHSGVQHVLCCVFVLFFFVLYTYVASFS